MSDKKFSTDAEVIGMHDPDYPEPTIADLESPLFNAVWKAIKRWDLKREGGWGYAGATGNDVMHILNTVEKELGEIKIS